MQLDRKKQALPTPAPTAAPVYKCQGAGHDGCKEVPAGTPGAASQGVCAESCHPGLQVCAKANGDCTSWAIMGTAADRANRNQNLEPAKFSTGENFLWEDFFGRMRYGESHVGG